jgi:hypothetical protein
MGREKDVPFVGTANAKEQWQFTKVTLPQYMREDGYTYYDAPLDGNVIARIQIHRRLRYVYLWIIRKADNVETIIGESIPLQWASGLRMLGED